jgi:branched-chain amino acid transport system permease protein
MKLPVPSLLRRFVAADPSFRTYLVFSLLAFAVLFSASYLVTNSYYMDIGVDMLLWAVLCVGLNIVMGFAGLLDLGYIGFYALGGYVYTVLSASHNWSFWATLPAIVIVVGGSGAVFGAPTLRLRGDYLAIMTLGFGEIVYIAANNDVGGLTGGPNGLYGMAAPSIGAVTIQEPGDFFRLTLVLLLLSVLTSRGLLASRIGRAWACIRSDELAARTLGMNTLYYKLLAYVIGASWAGLAGAVFAAKQGLISPESFVATQSFYAVSAVVLGGVGSIPGVIIGGVLYVLISEGFQGLAQQYSGLIFSGALLVMILLRPAGILPVRGSGFGGRRLSLGRWRTPKGTL